MPNKCNLISLPLTRKKYTPAFKAKCVRQIAAGARQTDVARTQCINRFARPLTALGVGRSRVYR